MACVDWSLFDTSRFEIGEPLSGLAHMVITWSTCNEMRYIFTFFVFATEEGVLGPEFSILIYIVKNTITCAEELFPAQGSVQF